MTVRAADRAAPRNLSAATLEKIKSAKTSPLIDGGKAVLFYRGEAQNVAAAGDFSNWNPNVRFEKVSENLFAREFDFDSSARVEYRLVIDGRWIEDPLNPNSLDNGVGGRNSFFAMPAYRAADRKTDENVRLEKLDLKAEALGGTRSVQVYVPEDCARAACATLYFQDGGDYVRRAGAVETQLGLVESGQLKPFIMVFVDPRERTKEYWASDDYARFLATELVPAIDGKYNTIKSRDARAVLGASLGGITSLHAGLKYPHVFARLGGQSSSFWVDNERVVKALEKLDAAQTRFTFYLDDGVLEGVEDSRRVNVMLRGKGFPVTYREGLTGHNWTSWRDRLADAMIGLWK